jgi:ABC-type ATPase involved in cell division/GNAT superfamily N-acetyltransferase|tara:strand:- start:3506 stop:4603 length:1098 start_codon:yes stop_codon:yes gene_type:complete
LKKLTSQVQVDNITSEISRMFDYEFNGQTEFVLPDFQKPTQEFNIGLIVGASGSGKSSLLKEFGQEENIVWDKNKAVCSHFDSPEEAQERLSCVGFNTIPSWMRPYHVLSTGEKFRSDLARRVKDNAVIDEFTSVVDRNVAKSCSNALQKFIRNKKIKNVVFASCHYDIIDWLQPDWVYDTNSSKVVTRGLLRRPKVVLEVVPCSPKIWPYFADHHYLTADISNASRCWLGTWEGTTVGFASVIFFPSGTIKEKAWREHRTVILPDFQGLGLGVRLSEAVAQQFTNIGHRFFSKTAHPRFGEYREAHPEKWRPTTHNKQHRKEDYEKELDRIASGKKKSPNFGGYSKELREKHKERVCYAHEFIG